AIQIIDRRSKVAHEQVQVAVVVVIPPGATGGIAVIGNDRSVGDHGELRVSRWRRELARSYRGHHAKQAALERSAAVSKTSRSAWEVRRRRELAACCGWSRTTQPRSVQCAIRGKPTGG